MSARAPAITTQPIQGKLKFLDGAEPFGTANINESHSCWALLSEDYY
jgi:hypothetical protein